MAHAVASSSFLFMLCKCKISDMPENGHDASDATSRRIGAYARQVEIQQPS